MRKELIGICFLFIFIFLAVSLFSYSPDDPSINVVKGPGPIHNLFGLVGAHVAGFLIALFGLGAFWVPLLLILSAVHLFRNRPQRTAWSTAAGGILLVITTGSILALYKDSYTWLEQEFHAGGIIGFALRDFLKKYANTAGGTMILLLFLLIGLILAISFSPTRFLKNCWKMLVTILGHANSIYTIWQARREKKKTLPKPKPPKSKKKAPEIKSQPPNIRIAAASAKPKQEEFEFMRTSEDFDLPPVRLLDNPGPRPSAVDSKNLQMQSMMLEKKLNDFGVDGKVVAVSPGPVITTFEYKPAPGVKINKIVNLSDDLALALRAISIRIVAPIPGKAAIGIEIPNATRELVYLKDIIASEAFQNSKSPLSVCLGKDIVGNPVVAELDKMPHLLIAGATGAGKSVGLNAMLTSLLYKSTPSDVKLIIVDPKRIELSAYNGVPHLITPVVIDMKNATNALHWAVHEMDRRYEFLSEQKCRNITEYNNKLKRAKKKGEKQDEEKLPYILIIIDELADMMVLASRDVEVSLTRLAQMARAAGLHLVLATQRPSVDVLTGIIKANFPTRISFQVSSKIDSRTILDANGAENLLGEGDMLFQPPGTAKLQRIHGAYISEQELRQVTTFLKEQKPPNYDEAVTRAPEKNETNEDGLEHDDRYDEAVALVTQKKQASISMVQRHLRIGYNRAARIIEVMEVEGVVGPSDGVKPREVLVRGYDEIE